MSEISIPPKGEELDRAMAEAYRYYQQNILHAGQLVYQITLGTRNGMDEKELLRLALRALDRMGGTDLEALLEAPPQSGEAGEVLDI